VRSHLVPDDCISEWAIEKSRITHPDIDHVLVSGSNFVANCFDVLPDRFDVLLNRIDSNLRPDDVLVDRLDLDLRPDGSLHLHTESAKVSLDTHN
jgi:hypothetical protein